MVENKSNQYQNMCRKSFLRLEHGGRTTDLTIPCSDEEIREKIRELNLTSSSDIKIELLDTTFGETVLFDAVEMFVEDEPIEVLNEYMKVINTVDFDVEKLTAACKMTERYDPKSVIKTIENLNNIIFIENADDYGDVGRYFLKNIPKYAVHPELEKHFCFYNFGYEKGEMNQGVFVTRNFGEIGFVCMADGMSIDDIFKEKTEDE